MNFRRKFDTYWRADSSSAASQTMSERCLTPDFIGAPSHPMTHFEFKHAGFTVEATREGDWWDGHLYDEEGEPIDAFSYRYDLRYPGELIVSFDVPDRDALLRALYLRCHLASKGESPNCPNVMVTVSGTTTTATQYVPDSGWIGEYGRIPYRYVHAPLQANAEVFANEIPQSTRAMLAARIWEEVAKREENGGMTNPRNEPKAVCIARRGQVAIAALILMHTYGVAKLHAYTFHGETLSTGMPQVFEALGLPKGQHINVQVIDWDVPASVADARVISDFTAAVQANDTAYFYGMVNSSGGQG